MLNCPSSQSKPSSWRLFCVISTNLASISTCFGPETLASSTSASTSSRLSCGVAHDQPAALRQKIRARPRRKRDALRLEKFFRGFPIHQLASASGFLRVLPGRPHDRTVPPATALDATAA